MLKGRAESHGKPHNKYKHIEHNETRQQQQQQQQQNKTTTAEATRMTATIITPSRIRSVVRLAHTCAPHTLNGYRHLADSFWLAPASCWLLLAAVSQPGLGAESATRL